MSQWYLWLKWLHVVSATVLLGTGAGIAFFFVRANRTRDPKVIAVVAREVVFADFLFTATAVVLQLVTGIAMMSLLGFSFAQHWLRWSVGLYLFIGACWLPVVWLQVRLRDIAAASAARGEALPSSYWRYYRLWFRLGFPAFFGVLAVFYLMIFKP